MVRLAADHDDQPGFVQRTRDGRAVCGSELAPLPVFPGERAQRVHRALAPGVVAGQRAEAQQEVGSGRVVLDRLLAYREAARRIACRSVPEPAGLLILELRAHRSCELRGRGQGVRPVSGLVFVDDRRDDRDVVGEETPYFSAVGPSRVQQTRPIPYLLQGLHDRPAAFARRGVAERVRRAEVRRRRQRIPVRVDAAIHEWRAVRGPARRIQRVVMLVGVLRPRERLNVVAPQRRVHPAHDVADDAVVASGRERAMGFAVDGQEL